MSTTYGTTSIPSDQITVRSGGTVAIGVAFDRTLGLVGGMDTANGSATPGAVETIGSVPDAEGAFGADSELARVVDTAFAQNSPPTTIYAVGVSETEVTAEAAGGSSGALANAPVFDPNVQPDHDIVAADTSGTDPAVEIVYESPPPTPSSSDTVNVNPITGEFEFDAAAAGSYEFDYVYGDYVSAISEVADKTPRVLTVLTESESVANDLLSEVQTKAQDFDFIRGVAGAGVEVDPSNYSDAIDARRLSLVAPARAYTDGANTEEVRTLGALGGKLAGKALGDSVTAEPLAGLVDLRRAYTNSELGNLIDAEVLPLKQGGGIKVVKDMTTSSTTKFERVYANEIVDEATEISHLIAEQYLGDRNTASRRVELENSHATSFRELQKGGLLEDFTVSTSKGADDFEVDVNVGLDVIGIIDTIDTEITVGDVVRNDGAS